MRSIKRKNIFIAVISVLLLWSGAHTAVIVADGLRDDGRKADYGVVLGNKVNEDGTLSRCLEKRMECALQLYRDGRVRGLIVSGGLGKEGHYEGDKMRDYLTAHGVPTEVITVDNDGYNTRATVRNTLRMSDSLGFGSLIVVSQYFHITRTKMLFRRMGFENVTGVSPRFFELRDIYSLAREFAAFYMQCFGHERIYGGDSVPNDERGGDPEPQKQEVGDE